METNQSSSKIFGAGRVQVSAEANLLLEINFVHRLHVATSMGSSKKNRKKSKGGGGCGSPLPPSPQMAKPASEAAPGLEPATIPSREPSYPSADTVQVITQTLVEPVPALMPAEAVNSSLELEKTPPPQTPVSATKPSRHLPQNKIRATAVDLVRYSMHISTFQLDLNRLTSFLY